MSWKLPSHLPIPPQKPALLAWSSWGLSPRLAHLAQRVPMGTSVIDVGTDHAKLPLALVASGRASRAIAADASETPLKQAALRVAKSGLQGHIELRHGNGLSVLRVVQGETVDVLLMAGISGETVAQVLSEAAPLEKLGLQHLILQPNDKEPLVRKTLMELGWTLESEEFVWDGKRFFLTMTAIQEAIRDETRKQTSWLVPYLALEDPLLPAWMDVKQRWLQSFQKPTAHPLYGEDYFSSLRRELQELSQKIESKLH